MTRIWGLVLALWTDWIRNRQAVFFSLLFPIVLLLIFSTVFAGGAPEFTVHVQNKDITADGSPSNISAAYIESLNDTDPLTVKRLDPDRNLTAWSRNDQSLGAKRVLVIPDGFAAGVRARSQAVRIAVIRDTIQRAGGQINASQRQQIQRGLAQTAGETNQTNASTETAILFLTSGDDETAAVVRGILESHMAEFNQRAIGVDAPPARISAGELGTQRLTAVDYYLPAFIAAIILLNGVVTVTSVISQFNQDGTLKRLVATPLRKWEWILGNLIHQSILALILTAVMLGVARLVFGVTALPGVLSIALILLGAIGFTGIGIALGSFLSNPDAAIGLGNAIAFPMMFLGGVFWEIDLMPESLRFLARLMPVYHFHQGLRQLMIVGTTDGVLVPFGLMGGMAVVFIGIAVRLTGWKDLAD